MSAAPPHVLGVCRWCVMSTCLVLATCLGCPSRLCAAYCVYQSPVLTACVLTVCVLTACVLSMCVLTVCYSDRKRPERLLSRLKSVSDDSGPRVVITRQPRGPAEPGFLLPRTVVTPTTSDEPAGLPADPPAENSSPAPGEDTPIPTAAAAATDDAAATN